MTNIDTLNLSQLENLANSIPSLRLLKQAKTLTQYQVWKHIRSRETLTALYWMGMQEGQGDLLKPLVALNIITQQAYDYIVLKYDMYLHLWILCVRAEESVKAECKQQSILYPFNNPYELFLKTVQEQGDYAFSLCLSSLRSFSARKSANGSQLLAFFLRGEVLDEDAKKLLKSLSPNTGCEPFWIHLVQKVGRKAKKKSSLGRAFNLYCIVCADTSQGLATLIRKGHSVAISKDGLMRGSRYGGKYEPNP